MRVPLPGLESVTSSPATADSRSRMFTKPAPCGVERGIEAGAVVAHLDAQGAVVGEVDHRRARAVRVLGRVLQRLEAAEVGRRLDLARVAADARGEQRRRQRRQQRRRAQRVDEPAIGERRRIDPARERAHLVDRVLDLGAEPAQRRGALRVLAVGLLGHQLELDAQRDEPLLGAVVEVALDPAALVVGGRLDARARVADLAQERARLRRQPLVVERHERVRRRGRDERVVVAQPGVVRRSPPPARRRRGPP